MKKNIIGISIYQNKYNPNKFIELKRYPDGHYYWRQYMHWVNGATGDDIINYTGGKRFSRVTTQTFIPVLSDDYNFIGGGIA